MVTASLVEKQKQKNFSVLKLFLVLIIYVKRSTVILKFFSDCRMGLELADVTELFRNREFKLMVQSTLVTSLTVMALYAFELSPLDGPFNASP